MSVALNEIRDLGSHSRRKCASTLTFNLWYLPLCIVSLTILVLEQSACIVSTANRRSVMKNKTTQIINDNYKSRCFELYLNTPDPGCSKAG